MQRHNDGESRSFSFSSNLCGIQLQVRLSTPRTGTELRKGTVTWSHLAFPATDETQLATADKDFLLRLCFVNDFDNLAILLHFLNLSCTWLYSGFSVT